jgi:uncharacterized protein (DUF885 family)
MRHLALAFALLFATPALAGPNEAVDAIIADHWRWWLSAHPTEATALGVRSYDDQLADISLSKADADAATAQRLLDQLNAIADASLLEAQRTNKGVLARILSDQIAGNRFGQRMMLFTTYAGWHQSFADLSSGLPFYTWADYETYLVRLNAYARYNREAIRISEQALKAGFVQPCVALGGFENTIMGAVAGPPESTRFYEPLTRPRPASISESDWQWLKERAELVITKVVVPEYKAFDTFYRTQYKPKCRKTVGASAMPQGRDWYALQARIHTTTDLTPEQIHQIGLDEVTRIGARMDGLAKQAGYADRTGFVAALRADPAAVAASPEAMLSAAARVAKQIDGQMPRYFATLPRLPYGLKAIPAETAETTTTAYYSPGSPTSGIVGNYFVNTSKLPQRPLWELPALTAHEAVPGHHNQIARQQELPLPEFRKYAANFTAYVEGWGLYSEYLGEEMGLYDTPAKMMGRLSFEMWRACRLVVDTGMHAKGWSKDQAVNYMRTQTALSDANIEAEVNRYISWPGQALGYKIGEIRIRSLRDKAQKALGARFDLRRFHDAVLGQGAVPLDVLESRIDLWIAAEQKAP